MRVRGFVLVGLLAAASGCALLSRGETVRIRYFDPSMPPDPRAPRAYAGCELALGRIDMAQSLREEIEIRRSAYEVGYYETRRWTESPDNYLRRAVERALFEDDRCRRVISPAAMTLDLSLVAFEERSCPESAYVAVHVLLHDDTVVFYDATLEATRRIPGRGDGFEGVPRAMGTALADVVGRLADDVEASTRRAAGRASQPK